MAGATKSPLKSSKSSSSALPQRTPAKTRLQASPKKLSKVVPCSQQSVEVEYIGSVCGLNQMYPGLEAAVLKSTIPRKQLPKPNLVLDSKVLHSKKQNEMEVHQIKRKRGRPKKSSLRATAITISEKVTSFEDPIKTELMPMTISQLSRQRHPLGRIAYKFYPSLHKRFRETQTETTLDL